MDARGISGNFDVSSKEPVELVVVDSTKLTADEQSAVAAYQKELHEWKQSEAIVNQQIASTIPDSLFMQVRGQQTVKDERCGEGEDIRTHFDTMRTMREDLAAIGGSISNEAFTAMILRSLPTLYDAYLSAITATVSVTNTALNPEAMCSATPSWD